jgi:hypothetical protein
MTNFSLKNFYDQFVVIYLSDNYKYACDQCLPLLRLIFSSRLQDHCLDMTKYIFLCAIDGTLAVFLCNKQNGNKLVASMPLSVKQIIYSNRNILAW